MTEPEAKPGLPKRVRRKLDRLLLGVVVGGAVGSILGITLAPKSGRETREIIGKRSRETWKKISEVIEERDARRDKKARGGFWHFLHRLFIRKRDNGDDT